jgi:hypothetical protein
MKIYVCGIILFENLDHAKKNLVHVHLVCSILLFEKI